MAFPIIELPQITAEKEYRKTKLKAIDFYLSHLNIGEIVAIEKLTHQLCYSNSQSYKDWIDKESEKQIPERFRLK